MRCAEVCRNVGQEGESCSFNQTLSIDTLDQVKESMEWRPATPDIVHTMVFILFRTQELYGDGFHVLANGQPVDIRNTYERPEMGGNVMLRAKDAGRRIRRTRSGLPAFAYLSSGQDPNATKSLRSLASKKQGFGYVRPEAIKVTPSRHHLLKGTWMSYASARSTRMGRTTMALFSLVAAHERLEGTSSNLVESSSTLLIGLVQLSSIIQPMDVLPDGRTACTTES